MANLTYPGVYVEEVSSGVRPIQAAGTSTAAFIGVAEKGNLAEAVKVYNFTEYQNLFGGFLNSSFLSHSVYQFFNNGGSQCYIVRVAENTATANIVINDYGVSTQPSLTISAISPGAWGNRLEVVITQGSSDPANEFNLLVYLQDAQEPANPAKAILLERFENLSMVPSSPRFIEAVTAASKQIRVVVNAGNTNVQAGTSRNTAAPARVVSGRTKLRVNINGDGYQEVDLQAAVGSGIGQVTDLTTPEHIAGAITSSVTRLTRLRTSTDPTAFTLFTCTLDTTGRLRLSSGTTGLDSSVSVAPAINSSQDASGLLKLGKLNGGTETIGASVTRPALGTYAVGDNATTEQVLSVRAGSDGDPVTSDMPYIDALARLDTLDDVSLIAIPGIGSEAILGAGMNYCANRSLSDCFFIGDMRQDHDTVPEAEAFVAAISPKNSYGAVYTPWVKMLDPTGVSSEPILVPPSGYVAGLYAKTDAQRGVWKAPAGTSVALGGATGLAVNFTDVQQGDLNQKSVNCIRQFAGAGIVLWGARTIAADPEYLYIPVRRTAILLRTSIYRGIQWAVFEPNDEPLWSQLRLNIKSFMTVLFRRGAFQGATPSQAFFVKCDGETTTQDDINLGIVNVLVGFAPLKPAEFVVVKISQKAGQN
ncbi:MAG: phage tail sheath subtilisin-like domain-containing protein [Chloroflexales bacterium]